MLGSVRTEKSDEDVFPSASKGLFRSEVRPVEALEDLTLQIRPSEIFGLLGPNGAGKTTLIKFLTTLLLPSRGDAWVNGYHVVGEENAVRASVGCMLVGERGLYWKLTGRENLEFFGALYHLPPAVRRRRATEILELLGMQELADCTAEIGQTMSAFLGMVRKEFLIMSRYPVEFIASFGQIFAIVAMFTLAALTFGGEGREGTSSPGGVVVYGLTLFLSDTLWGIGYNIRREQTQGTLEQLYLSRRRSSAAWFRG